MTEKKSQQAARKEAKALAKTVTNKILAISENKRIPGKDALEIIEETEMTLDACLKVQEYKNSKTEHTPDED